MFGFTKATGAPSAAPSTIESALPFLMAAIGLVSDVTRSGGVGEEAADTAASRLLVALDRASELYLGGTTLQISGVRREGRAGVLDVFGRAESQQSRFLANYAVATLILGGEAFVRGHSLVMTESVRAARRAAVEEQERQEAARAKAQEQARYRQRMETLAANERARIERQGPEKIHAAAALGFGTNFKAFDALYGFYLLDSPKPKLRCIQCGGRCALKALPAPGGFPHAEFCLARLETPACVAVAAAAK